MQPSDKIDNYLYKIIVYILIVFYPITIIAKLFFRNTYKKIYEYIDIYIHKTKLSNHDIFEIANKGINDISPRLKSEFVNINRYLYLIKKTIQRRDTRLIENKTIYEMLIGYENKIEAPSLVKFKRNKIAYSICRIPDKLLQSESIEGHKKILLILDTLKVFTESIR